MTLFLALWLSVISHASEMKCIAPFDDSSYYQLLAQVKNSRIEGSVGFSYVTTDGLDLRAKLKPSAQEVIPGKKFSFVGSDGNMEVKAGADFVTQDNNYQGSMEVSFNYDGTSPVAVAMKCAIYNFMSRKSGGIKIQIE